MSSSKSNNKSLLVEIKNSQMLYYIIKIIKNL